MSDRAEGLTRIGDSVVHRRVALAADLFMTNHAALLALARGTSICAADAEDALQRSMEIFLRSAPAGPHDRPLSWLRVVIRREATAVRRQRERLLDAAARGVVGRLAEHHSGCDRAGPAEQFAARDRGREAASRLARLKRDQRRAIGLQAAGCSYEEIAAICDWTYTKVNRSLAEGRLALRQ